MSVMKSRWLILYLLGLLILAGCACEPAEIQAFNVIVDGPADGAVVDAYPTFNWHDEESCKPPRFRIYTGQRKNYYSGGSSEFAPGAVVLYTWQGILEAGGKYYWDMSAESDPYAFYGPDTEERDIYIGPLCSGETLIAPELYRPQNAGWVTGPGPEEFEWYYEGGCLPPSYEYQFASDPGFADIIDSGTTADHQQIINKTFPNCSTVFWRARAQDGTSIGPWSDVRDFHWVEDETCYQNHYISDDAARIQVRLFEDICSETGYSMAPYLILPSGCTSSEGMIHADGIKNGSESSMYDFIVDLGSGPCPSTGLDQKNNPGWWNPFHVVAPGTYCVSISRNQTVGANVDLMDGIWTEPRISGLVAEKTLEIGPGLHDLAVDFGWDEMDKIFLLYPVPENIFCRQYPEPPCDPLGIFMAGELLPIIARDMNSEWKMTQYNGQSCFIYQSSELIDEAMMLMPEVEWRTADLPFYDPQPSCQEPEAERECSSYNGQAGCAAAGCTWNPPPPLGGAGSCSN